MSLFGACKDAGYCLETCGVCASIEPPKKSPHQPAEPKRYVPRERPCMHKWVNSRGRTHCFWCREERNISKRWDPFGVYEAHK